MGSKAALPNRTDTLPRLCAITDRALAREPSLCAITEALIRGGARWIQIREKTLPAAALLTEARRAVEAARTAGALLVVNDRADIALAAEADGVHVGRDDLPPQDARRFLGPDALIGVSTHSVEEGIAASDLPVDYVAIGPIFPTRTKPDADRVVGIESVRRLASAISLPVVAIGGIDARSAPQVLEAGASAVAVIAALYSGRSIEDGVSALLQVV